ncbi:hypothetical protein T8K17_01630 [Thalassobaculum sp. OXR-137]|uniref:hypothetical protein n=1 Tax=Thalassobaculum sp. OXR-137 TaxID=3100173 RepID=UPI002AC9DDDF|nr:hypothetical protein [Thalassobaculum sp. OXR-137]WPZ34850.1 hypothetical protein T8K17_01630 [Thalassobaculum sp. OXR-137]
MTGSWNRRTAILLLAGFCGIGLAPLPAASEQVVIEKLLSNDLPLYQPETMAELNRLSAAAAQQRLPLDAQLNEMGMYDAVIDGKKVWINPADVVTSDAAALKERCHANAGTQASSSTARAFGSGCQ